MNVENFDFMITITTSPIFERIRLFGWIFNSSIENLRLIALNFDNLFLQRNSSVEMTAKNS